MLAPLCLIEENFTLAPFGSDIQTFSKPNETGQAGHTQLNKKWRMKREIAIRRYKWYGHTDFGILWFIWPDCFLESVKVIFDVSGVCTDSILLTHLQKFYKNCKMRPWSELYCNGPVQQRASGKLCWFVFKNCSVKPMVRKQIQCKKVSF